MVCPKCKKNNVFVDRVPSLGVKRRGFLNQILHILLVILTLSLIELIPYIKKRIKDPKKYNIAICKECGFSWQVVVKHKSRHKIRRRQLP